MLILHFFIFGYHKLKWTSSRSQEYFRKFRLKSIADPNREKTTRLLKWAGFEVNSLNDWEKATRELKKPF